MVDFCIIILTNKQTIKPSLNSCFLLIFYDYILLRTLKMLFCPYFFFLQVPYCDCRFVAMEISNDIILEGLEYAIN